MIWRVLFVIPWVIFLAYWIYGALRTRRTVRTESAVSRYGILALELLGFGLLFLDHTGIEFLDRHIVQQSDAQALIGVALTWIGIGIAVWARYHLGQYWSARVTLKEGHQLIRTGPYAHFRHPIYSGLDLAALGGVVAIGEVRSVLGLVLIIAGYWIKARTEERMLSAQFGDQFREHCRRTGFLLPKFSPMRYRLRKK
jgi:protein-S-isoprenylcysteine O-methyltransferase Ste14